jgi:hypothetical protein
LAHKNEVVVVKTAPPKLVANWHKMDPLQCNELGREVMQHDWRGRAYAHFLLSNAKSGQIFVKIPITKEA